jgi:hypothetical protein
LYYQKKPLAYKLSKHWFNIRYSQYANTERRLALPCYSSHGNSYTIIVIFSSLFYSSVSVAHCFCTKHWAIHITGGPARHKKVKPKTWRIPPCTKNCHLRIHWYEGTRPRNITNSNRLIITARSSVGRAFDSYRG